MMRIKRVLILAGVVAGVIALCVTGLAAATPGHPPVVPPPYPQVSAANAGTGTNFFAWQQHNFNLSPLCQGRWDHYGTCNPGSGSQYDMAFEITATVTNGGVTTPVTFNQLSPLPPTDDFSIPSTCFTSSSCSQINSSWAAAADDFVITTTPGVTATITDIRVLGVFPGGTITATTAVNVCFYNDNGGLIPAALPGSTGLCATNQGITPTAIALGPFTFDRYFSVHLTTPQTYTSTPSTTVGTHWLMVQVNDPNTTWYWYNAISSFSWPYGAFVPFVRR